MPTTAHQRDASEFLGIKLDEFDEQTECNEEVDAFEPSSMFTRSLSGRHQAGTSSMLMRRSMSLPMNMPVYRGMLARLSNEETVDSSLNMVPPSFHVATASRTEEELTQQTAQESETEPLLDVVSGKKTNQQRMPDNSTNQQRKASENWRRLMELNKITSMFKPQSYVAPPYVSFMPDQVTLHLINNHGSENLDLPATNAMQGAVMFADASGFTAMSQRLASKVGFN